MRRLIKWIAGLALLYALWWGGVAFAVRAGATSWLNSNHPQGRTGAISKIESTGFPTRVVTKLSNLSLPAEVAGYEVSSGPFELSMPAIWPGYASLTQVDDKIEFTQGSLSLALAAQSTHADVRVRPSVDLSLQKLSFESFDWFIEGAQETLVSGQKLSVEMRAVEQQPNAYTLQFDADELTPSATVRNLLKVPQDWPYLFEILTFSGSVELARPLNRHSLTEKNIQFRQLRIDRAKAQWADVSLSLSGALDIDTTGLPTGDLSLLVNNWRDALVVAQSHNLPILARAELMLNALANLGGDPETLDLTLSFRDGATSLSGIPLGPAPLIRLP